MRAAVVGAGVVGLSVAARLLAGGADVVCYERSGAAMGERSAGSSRIFRLAHSTPTLVRLTQRARDGFRRWEEGVGTQILSGHECVVSTPDLTQWSAAMEEADARYHVVEGSSDRLRLPATAPPAASLIDPGGGVIDVDAVRAYLVALTKAAVVHEPVFALENGSSGTDVWSPSGRARFDTVVIAAGAGTLPLAAQVGIYTPSSLAHHVRFTFPVDPSVRWQCWIDKPADGLGTYQHLSGPGKWSVGGHVDPASTAWAVGRDEATAASREAVLRYAGEHLVVEPRIVESLYCTTVPNLGDGFEVRRNGRILVIHGQNLFKLAPVLGDVLASACMDGSTPTVDELVSD